tara:strand:+ start:203 stop:967 length:765 start_codon:yes stop_codon:yes gene_type:complete
MTSTVIIDLGYVSFYRYHAAKRWWSFKTDKNQEDPWQNEEEFRNTLLKQYDKNLKKYIKNRVGFLAMESMDSNWRRDEYKEYKANRPKNSDIYSYFCYLLHDFLPKFVEKNNNCALLHRSGFEADDLIALKVYELQKQSVPEIRIISVDTDFLQLVELNNTVRMYDATEKLKSDKPLIGQAYLRRKIVFGDTADNIKPIFKGKGCSQKKLLLVEKLNSIHNLDNVSRELFADDSSYDRFLLNRKLIDFKMIPSM